MEQEMMSIKESILEGTIPNDYEAAYQLLIQKAAEMNIKPLARPASEW